MISVSPSARSAERGEPPVLVLTTTRDDRAITLGCCQTLRKGTLPRNDDLNSIGSNFTGKLYQALGSIAGVCVGDNFRLTRRLANWPARFWGCECNKDVSALTLCAFRALRILQRLLGAGARLCARWAKTRALSLSLPNHVSDPTGEKITPSLFVCRRP